MSERMDPIPPNTYPEERKPETVRTISLISYPSKVMLTVLLNRIKWKAEGILAEEQAGFQQKRSTEEQIFNIRLLI